MERPVYTPKFHETARPDPAILRRERARRDFNDKLESILKEDAPILVAAGYRKFSGADEGRKGRIHVIESSRAPLSRTLSRQTANAVAAVRDLMQGHVSGAMQAMEALTHNNYHIATDIKHSRRHDCTGGDTSDTEFDNALVRAVYGRPRAVIRLGAMIADYQKRGKEIAKADQWERERRTRDLKDRIQCYRQESVFGRAFLGALLPQGRIYERFEQEWDKWDASMLKVLQAVHTDQETVLHENGARVLDVGCALGDIIQGGLEMR